MDELSASLRKRRITTNTTSSIIAEKSIKLEDTISEFPAHWLPDEVKNFVLAHEQKLLKYQQDIKSFEIKSRKNSVWNEESMLRFKKLLKSNPEILLETWQKIKPAFCNEEMKQVWGKLQKISPEAPLLLAQKIFFILNLNRSLLKSCESREKEIELIHDVKARLLKLEDDIEKIDQGKSNGLGIFCFRILIDYLVHQSQTLEINNKVLSKNGEAFHFLNQKSNAVQGKATYFVRTLSKFMRDTFGSPYNETVASFTNIIFETEYSGNDIIKLCKKYRE